MHENSTYDQLVKLYGKESKKKTPKRVKKVGRNEPCPCGSGKKYKNCCEKVSQVWEIPVFTLIRTDTTLDLSQEAEKV